MLGLASYKEVLAVAAVLLTFAMYVPYIRSIQDGRTKPHAFSWIIWSLASIVVFLAQTAGRGGAGAWPIGVSGLISAYIAVLAYRSPSDTSITTADWMFLIVAVAALPSWLATSSPLLAVALLTAIELAGFGPTFRFAHGHPYGERMGFFVLGAARNVIAISALEHYSLTTVLFPAAKVIACVALVLAVAYWRARLRLRGEHGGAA